MCRNRCTTTSPYWSHSGFWMTHFQDLVWSHRLERGSLFGAWIMPGNLAGSRIKRKARRSIPNPSCPHRYSTWQQSHEYHEQSQQNRVRRQKWRSEQDIASSCWFRLVCQYYIHLRRHVWPVNRQIGVKARQHGSLCNRTSNSPNAPALWAWTTCSDILSRFRCEKGSISWKSLRSNTPPPWETIGAFFFRAPIRRCIKLWLFSVFIVTCTYLRRLIVMSHC